METPNLQQIKQYLWENHHITPEELFDPNAKYHVRTHEIMNDTFKHFTGHSIEFDGILITQHPRNKLEVIYYEHYKNFHHINSLKDFRKDMKTINELNEERANSLETRLQELQKSRKPKPRNLGL